MTTKQTSAPRRPWMPFYVGDFHADVAGLKADERGVYITMICLAWRSGNGSVSGDMKELKAVLQNLIANFHGLTFNRIVPKLLDRFFERRADGRFYQERVENELRKAEEMSEKQSRNAKERWSQTRENNHLADANAMPHNTTQHNTYKRGTSFAPLANGSLARPKKQDAWRGRKAEEGAEGTRNPFGQPNLSSLGTSGGVPRDGRVFVQEWSPEWLAWKQCAGRFPKQYQHRVNGKLETGSWFRTEWPSSEYKPRPQASLSAAATDTNVVFLDARVLIRERAA